MAQHEDTRSDALRFGPPLWVPMAPAGLLACALTDVLLRALRAREDRGPRPDESAPDAVTRGPLPSLPS